MKTFKVQLPVTIATFVSLVVLGAALLILQRSIRGQDESWEWVVHTREVLEQLQTTLTHVSDAEAAQRGFLLTGNELFVASYRQARDAVPAELRTLEALTKDNPRQQGSLKPLDAWMMQRLAMLEAVIEQKRRGVEPSAAMLESGRLLRQKILAQVNLIRVEERRLLAERQARAEAARRDLVTAVGVVATLSVCLIILLWVISSRDAARLLSERARLDATLRSIGDGVIATDAAGTVRLMNPVSEALTGTAETSAVGRPLDQVLQVRDQASGAALATAALRADRGAHPLLLSGGGSDYTIELSAAPIDARRAGTEGTVIVFRDVTERIRRETELNMRLAQIETIYRAVPVGLGYVGADLRLAELNDALVEVAGRPRQACIGEPPSGVFPGPLGVHVSERLAQVLQARHQVGGVEFHSELPGRPDQRRDWLGSFYPVIDDNEVNGIVLALLEVTQIKTAQRELIAANESLEARIEERTARIGEANAELRAFAHTVAHDLRAPLRNVEGFATALLEDEAERMSEDGKLFAERIVAAVTRMDRLITDLLAYSRLSRAELRFEAVDTNAVMKSVLRDLEAQVGDSGARIAIAPALPTVRANGAVLVQIVANLVSNAIKFVAPGVVPEIAIRGSADGATARLLIEDNGIGIAPEHREHVFGVFERLHGHEKYPGTGIGLAIVRKGLERMGGSVRILGRPQGGTAFELVLPAA